MNQQLGRQSSSKFLRNKNQAEQILHIQSSHKWKSSLEFFLKIEFIYLCTLILKPKYVTHVTNTKPDL